MNTYYKLSNKALTFDINKEVDLIRFNHYLMQKENLQRLKGNLTKGCLELSSKIISDDMKIDINKAKRLVKKFLELGIIKAISVSKKKGVASVYSYCTFASKGEPNHEPKKVSNTNALNKMAEQASEPIYEPSKKELLKISCCCLEEPHKKFENENVEGASLFEDERVALVKSYGFNVTNAQEKLIEKMDKDRLLQAIEISVAQEANTFSYIYKVYLNNKKAPTTVIVDAKSSNIHRTKINNHIISKKNKKDKAIYMCKSIVEMNGKLVDTDTLSDDTFDRLVEEKQRLKWA